MNEDTLIVYGDLDELISIAHAPAMTHVKIVPLLEKLKEDYHLTSPDLETALCEIPRTIRIGIDSYWSDMEKIEKLCNERPCHFSYLMGTCHGDGCEDDGMSTHYSALGVGKQLMYASIDSHRLILLDLMRGYDFPKSWERGSANLLMADGIAKIVDHGKVGDLEMSAFFTPTVSSNLTNLKNSIQLFETPCDFDIIKLKSDTRFTVFKRVNDE